MNPQGLDRFDQAHSKTPQQDLPQQATPNQCLHPWLTWALYPFNTGGQPKCRGRGGLTNALGPDIILLATRRKDSETKPTKQASNAKTTESRREVEEQRASGRSGIQREGIEYML